MSIRLQPYFLTELRVGSDLGEYATNLRNLGQLKRELVLLYD